MKDLLQATARLTLGMSLLGLRQLGRVPGTQAAWEAVRRSTGDGSIFEDGLAPRSWTALPLAMAEGSALVLKHLPGQELEWKEVQNKVQAFTFFRHAYRHWDGDLRRSVARTASLEPWPRLWTLEGLGWILAERATERGLLRDADAPDESLVCLHPGLGLCLAARRFSVPEPIYELEGFLELCRRSSRPGWERVTFEALGLVLRGRSSRLLAEVDRELHRLDADLVPWFWHGAGRGHCFAPLHTLPYLDSVGRALKQARTEPPHEVGRLNAVSGLAWALTLVNLRHPAILEAAVCNHPLEGAESEAWSQGMSSALLLWSRAIGRDAILDTFLGHPGSETWERRVRRPCEEALETRRAGPEMFRYEP